MAREMRDNRGNKRDYGRKRYSDYKRKRSGGGRFLGIIFIAALILFGALTCFRQERLLVEYAGRVPGKAGSLLLGGAETVAGWSLEVRSGWQRLVGIVREKSGEEGYKVGDKAFFRNDLEIKSQDVSYDFEPEVSGVEIHAGGYLVHWLPSWDGGIHIQGENTDKIQAYTEGGVLLVKATRAAVLVEDVRKARIRVYVPEGYTFQNVLVDIGVGAMEGAGLSAEHLEVKVGAGEVSLTDAACTSLMADVGAGKLDMKGRIGTGGNITCAAGSASLDLENGERDFNYELNNVAGRVIVGKTDLTGLVREKKIENGAEGRIVLDCSVGNIEVRLADS